jgi:hypothetical protein
LDISVQPGAVAVETSLAPGGRVVRPRPVVLVAVAVVVVDHPPPVELGGMAAWAAFWFGLGRTYLTKCKISGLAQDQTAYRRQLDA